MKKVLILASTLLAAFPSSVMASTSGTLQGTLSVGYSCDITIPSAATLTPDGSSATGSSLLPYSQNANTDYTLSPLLITAPASSDISGTISIRDGSATEVVNNSSEAVPSSGQLTGNTSGTGSVVFTLNENTASAFLSGDYSVSSVLSCSQS